MAALLLLPFLCYPLLLLLTVTTQSSIAYSFSHRRSLLHQPLFPFDSTLSPTQPPSLSPQTQPQTQPKLPFSSTSSSSSSSSTPSEKPFFPSYRTPTPPLPPPSPTALTSFPANISSLMLPHSSSHSNRHVIVIAVVASLISAAFIASLAGVLLHFRRRRNRLSVADHQDDKTSRSDSLRLYPPNTATSDGKPLSAATPNHSTEFLYLGTLANPDGGAAAASSSSGNGGVKISVSASNYQKLGSPELKPLPPLPKQNFKNRTAENNGGNDDDEEEEEDEEFFSPRGSGDSPGRAWSSSRRVEFQVDNKSDENEISKTNFGSRSFNSRTTSYPCSRSPSPATSVSTIRTMSPDSIINFINVSRPLPTPLSASPSSLSGAANSPSTMSSDVPKRFAAAKIPPPPPPFPPARFWELPAAAARIASGPPVFATPTGLRTTSTVSVGDGGCEQRSNNVGVECTDENNSLKPKLKPLHWDKVRASSDRAMVWDQLKSSSFQLNEEMIETLFMVSNSNAMGKDNGGFRQSLPCVVNDNRVLDPKKSQNIAILLRALNVTIEEVCEALLEGNSDTLGTELLESLLKMAPTKEEEWKLRDYKDDSPFKLGPAEKFLKAVLDIPFAFKRVDALLYIANFDSEIDYLKRSFSTLEVACVELKNSRMFMKLLEAVLKTGNRMNVGTNRGDARAFKLDTLLKLVDVKGADGKTTLLHFVVQEIIRAEGLRQSGADQNEASDRNNQSSYWDDVEFRKLGLQVVSGLSGELSNVKKAAAMDSDVLSNEVSKLAGGISRIAQVLKSNEEVPLKESSRKFSESMNEFLKRAEKEIENLQAQERAAIALVREITEYFHGNSAKEEAHRFRIFMVVRDFLSILDQVCKEVGKVNERSTVCLTSARKFPAPMNPTSAPIFPGLNRQQQYSSSDEESSSSSQC